MIHLNSFISCDTFKLLHAMWYIHTALYHVIHLKKNCSSLLFYYQDIVNHSSFLSQKRQSQYIVILKCDAFKLIYTMWYIQTLLCNVIPSNCAITSTNFFLYHVMHSNCVMPCDTFNLFYIMWYLQTPYIIWNIQTVLYPVIPLMYFMWCDTFKMFILYDTFKLLYAMWYL